MYHTLLKLHARTGGVPGSRLFNLKPASALRDLKRLGSFLRWQSVESCSWKAFRAGRATQLAADGEPLQAIFQAGEWRSAAFLRYVAADAADEGELLRLTLERDAFDGADAA